MQIIARPMTSPRPGTLNQMTAAMPLALISADGQVYHRFTSGIPPDVVDTSGCVLTLCSEIGRDSKVRIRFVNRDDAAVLQAVQIIDLRSVNPFAGNEP